MILKDNQLLELEKGYICYYHYDGIYVRCRHEVFRLIQKHYSSLIRDFFKYNAICIQCKIE